MDDDRNGKDLLEIGVQLKEILHFLGGCGYWKPHESNLITVHDIVAELKSAFARSTCALHELRDQEQSSARKMLLLEAEVEWAQQRLRTEVKHGKDLREQLQHLQVCTIILMHA